MKNRNHIRIWLMTIALLLASCNGAWAVAEQVIHNFHSFSGDGSQPQVELIRDAAGNLYGTTYVGGDFNAGAVFELSPVPGGGWNYSVLHSFGSTPELPGF